MDQIDFIIMVEEGGFNVEDEVHIASLQRMIDTSIIWKLQGSWQRFAKSMLKAKLVK
jgi:hypothetical protein